jgi:hypothetical protein
MNSEGDSNPYNLGYKRNWEAVLGPSKLLWFVPVNFHLTNGGGLAWPQSSQPGLVPSNDEVELSILSQEQHHVL